MGRLANRQITTSDVNGWIATLVADGLPGSVRQAHRVLSLILDAAFQGWDGLAAIRPVEPASRAVRKEPIFLTAEQVSALAEAARPHELTILTLAFTGLRFGELAALKVRRFDAQRKRLDVVESVTESEAKLVWTTPKTHQRQTGSDAVPQLAQEKSSWSGALPLRHPALQPPPHSGTPPRTEFTRSAAVFGRPLPSDVDSAFGHLISDAQGVEDTDGVAEQVDPGAFAGVDPAGVRRSQLQLPNRAACERRRARQCRHRRPELEHRHPAWDFKRLARRADGLAGALVRLAGRRSCHCGVGSRGCRRVGRVRSRSSGSATP
jgi:hypothetical protein